MIINFLKNIFHQKWLSSGRPREKNKILRASTGNFRKFSLTGHRDRNRFKDVRNKRSVPIT